MREPNKRGGRWVAELSRDADAFSDVFESDVRLKLLSIGMTRIDISPCH